MVKSDDTIEVEAIVKASLPNAMFRLEIMMGANKHEIIGHISGKMRRNYIRITPGDKVLRWSPDGRTIWIQRSSDVVVRVEQLDLASGRRAPLMSVRAGTGAGLLGIGFVQLADDPRGYAYIASEYVSHIFDVRGMR